MYALSNIIGAFIISNLLIYVLTHTHFFFQIFDLYRYFSDLLDVVDFRLNFAHLCSDSVSKIHRVVSFAS